MIKGLAEIGQYPPGRLAAYDRQNRRQPGYRHQSRQVEIADVAYQRYQQVPIGLRHVSRAEREEAERQRDQHPVEDGRKCLVEGIQHPQRIVSTGGLDDAERQSEQNAEKNDADELRPRQRSEDIGRHHALQERHDRTAGFDRRLAGELLAERCGGAFAEAFAGAENDAHQHRRGGWN